MKYVRRLILLALIAGYFLWPYQQVKKFGQAVAARDTSTVAGMIDEVAFKESIKELVIEATVFMKEQSLPAGVRFDKAEERGRIHAQMKSSAFTSAFDHVLKPERIARMLFAGQDLSEAHGTGSTPWRNEKWHSPVTFSVQDLNSDARVIFKFRGTGWKLAGFAIPAKDLGRFFPMQ
jgi:hypothetical protein